MCVCVCESCEQSHLRKIEYTKVYKEKETEVEQTETQTQNLFSNCNRIKFLEIETKVRNREIVNKDNFFKNKKREESACRPPARARVTRLKRITQMALACKGCSCLPQKRPTKGNVSGSMSCPKTAHVIARERHLNAPLHDQPYPLVI